MLSERSPARIGMRTRASARSMNGLRHARALAPEQQRIVGLESKFATCD